jgi:hypothetical protein
MRQTILPWYGAVPGDASVCITKHVPYFVSIVSPTIGSRGNSTSSKSSQVGAWIVILNRLMGHMMQDGNLRGIRHPSCSNSSRACPERPQPPEPSSSALRSASLRSSLRRQLRTASGDRTRGVSRSAGRSVRRTTNPQCACSPRSRNARVPLRKLALQVESCSPGLLRLARRSASGDCGLSAGVLVAGPVTTP